MNLLTIENLSFNYGNLPVLDDFSLELERYSRLALLGPSGCGKTTLIKVMAGLIQPQKVKSIFWQEQKTDLNNLADKISYMPQQHSLFPWLTVVDNIAMPLITEKHILRKEARREARQLLREFSLEDFADNYPQTLSGGMASRVAFLRTTISDKQLYLLDEPFAALDEINRELAQEWLNQHLAGDKTMILVTHSISEALIMADHIIVMGRRGQAPLLELRPRFTNREPHLLRCDPQFNIYASQIRTALKRTVERNL